MIDTEKKKSRLHGRHLSVPRLALLVFILTGIGVYAYYGAQTAYDRASIRHSQKSPWFASYVDVTATPAFPFEQLGESTSSDAMLSFIVSSDSDPCIPTWGNYFTMDQAAEKLDLDRRIARLQQQGGDIGISFGGLSNNELAVGCTDETQLKDAYASVLDRYKVSTIDLDLENTGLENEAATRRAKAIAKLQQERRTGDNNLAVWLTLPVIPQGLTPEGTNAVATLLENNVDLAGVNIMTMNFGESLGKSKSMQEGVKSAMTQTHRQLGILYDQANLPLSDATLWSKIGITPMIGQNDISSEVFELDDAKAVNEFTLKHKIGRVSMWSANRDRACGSNYINLKVVSTSCSGINQDKNAFAKILSKGYDGSISASSDTRTKSDKPETSQTEDNPETSPYQIWNEDGVYLEGTKVVWRQNVYQAKWWTKNDSPDNPVLQSWETPWELIGPVLAGEKPVEQSAVPAGMYPEWTGDATFDNGDQVVFNGTPFHAKWWNQGQSPAAAYSNPDASPWRPLTQREVEQSLQKSTN